MYKFVDTIESAASGSELPSEALKFNGKWLEEEIPGYQTLTVSGREMLSTEITDLEVGTNDGSRYQRKKYGTRTITIRFMLRAESNSAFRQAFNRLNEILDAEEAQLIFHDEPDKYFVGTKTGLNEVPAGTNSVVAEFNLLCTDPFKYSVEEKEVSPSLDNGLTFAVTYNGTYRSYPVLMATNKSDNGFLGFADAKNHILQFGNVEETDKESYEKSETLIDDSMVTGVAGWLLNQGTTVKVISEHKQTGTAGINSTQVRSALKALDYGTGNNWHGPSWTKKIPADSKGHVGARNCTFSWHHFFTTSSFANLGVVQFLMTDSNSKNVAAVTYFKNASGTNKGNVHCYVNGKVLRELEMDCSWSNAVTGDTAGRSSISKFGSKFEFNIAGQIYNFTVPEMESIEVAEISIFLGKWGNSDPVAINQVYSARFVSHSVQDWKDVPNKFGAADVLEADCRAGKVKVNGVEMPGLGALGNDWETFYLSPGANQIRCAYSDWATKPEFKLKYREVYI